MWDRRVRLALREAHASLFLELLLERFLRGTGMKGAYAHMRTIKTPSISRSAAACSTPHQSVCAAQEVRFWMDKEGGVRGARGRQRAGTQTHQGLCFSAGAFERAGHLLLSLGARAPCAVRTRGRARN